MKKDKKILAFGFCLLMLLQYNYVNAQPTTLKIHYQGGEHNYKPYSEPGHKMKEITSGFFIMEVSLKKEKIGNKFYVSLSTNSIKLTELDGYYWQSDFSNKMCYYGKIEEIPLRDIFHEKELGAAPFEQIKRTAVANFNMEFAVREKDGSGWMQGIIENVSEYGKFLSRPMWRDFDIETIKIFKRKTNQFYADESLIEPAVENYIIKLNEIAEAQCKKDEEDKKAKELSELEDDQKALAEEQEFAMVKEKITRSKNTQAKTDDFWSGGADKSTATNDDFWTGGKEKQKTTIDKKEITKSRGYAFVYLSFMNKCKYDRHDFLSNIFEIEEGCDDYVLKFYNKILSEYGKGCYDAQFLDDGLYSSLGSFKVYKTIDEPYFFDKFTGEIYGNTHQKNDKRTLEEIKILREKIIEKSQDPDRQITIGGHSIIFKEVDFQNCLR